MATTEIQRKPGQRKGLQKLHPACAVAMAQEALLAYYGIVDTGASFEEKNAAAEVVYQKVGPLLLAVARRLVPRRTGLRGARACHAIEDIQQTVLVYLLTRVRPESPKGRFNPAKRDLVVFAWVLVDRALVSGYCRRKSPSSFTQLDFREGLIACHRHRVVLDDLSLREKREEIRQAVSWLEEPTREVIRRVCLAGEGKKQVAISLRRSPAFVTRELARGMAGLAKLLAGPKGEMASVPYGDNQKSPNRNSGFWLGA